MPNHKASRQKDNDKYSTLLTWTQAITGSHPNLDSLLRLSEQVVNTLNPVTSEIDDQATYDRIAVDIRRVGALLLTTPNPYLIDGIRKCNPMKGVWTNDRCC